MYCKVVDLFHLLSCDYSSIEGVQGYMSLFLRKPVFGVSDLVEHKPGSTTTQDD